MVTHVACDMWGLSKVKVENYYCQQILVFEVFAFDV